MTLHFQKPYVAYGDVVGFITRANYNSEDKTIDVEIWTGVLLGAMTQSPFAWPTGLTEIDIWPQDHAVAAGGGGELSQPELPQFNAIRLPVGIRDGFGYIEAGSFEGPGLRLNWSSGDPTPGQAFDTPQVAQPADQLFPYTPLPIADPTQNYTYPTSPDPTIKPPIGVFPGKISSKLGPDPNNGNVILYQVDVYTTGLLNPPLSVPVGQLQIDPDDTIPTGSWTLVDFQQGVDANNKPIIEKTMQIPIWLQ